MSMNLAAIRVNVSKIAKKAATENQTLVLELARELDGLCEIIRLIEQRGKDANGPSAGKSHAGAG